LTTEDFLKSMFNSNITRPTKAEDLKLNQILTCLLKPLQRELMIVKLTWVSH